jgi:hypothetical protein
VAQGRSHILRSVRSPARHAKRRNRNRSRFLREESSSCNCRYLLKQLDLIAFNAGYLAYVKGKMLRVERIAPFQIDVAPFNFVHSTNMLSISVDNFHMFADIHSLSPWFAT